MGNPFQGRCHLGDIDSHGDGGYWDLGRQGWLSLLAQAATWMNPGDITLSERRQLQRQCLPDSAYMKSVHISEMKEGVARDGRG